MSHPEAEKILEKYLAERRFWLEVVLGAVILGCLVDFFAGAAQDSLKTWWPDGPGGLGWTLMSGSALLIIVGAVLVYLLQRDVVETSGLTMVLPLWVDTVGKKVEILHNRHYLPANYGRHLLSQAHKKIAPDFCRKWPGSNPIKSADFQPGQYCWETLQDLVHAILVKFLHDYGKDALLANAFYHGEFRRLAAANIKSAKLPREQWPDTWQQNIVLQAAGPQSLQLPKYARISHDQIPFPGPSFPHAGPPRPPGPGGRRQPGLLRRGRQNGAPQLRLCQKRAPPRPRPGERSPLPGLHPGVSRNRRPPGRLGLRPLFGLLSPAPLRPRRLGLRPPGGVPGPPGGPLHPGLINNRIFTAPDFYQHTSGGVYLYDEPRKRYFLEYDRFVTRPAPLPDEEGTADFRRLFRRQAERLRRTLLTGEPYAPFTFSW